MRPILLGMNNPLSRSPEHALYPYPPGCTGARILDLLRSRIPNLSRAQYLAAFDRRNLLSTPKWNDRRAAEAGVAFVEGVRDTGALVLVLGAGPRRALGLEQLLIHPQELHGVTWRQLPHPSGRNLWYNDEKNRAMVALLLEEAYQLSQRKSAA